MGRTYTEEQQFKIKLFRDSVRLQDPAIETDPVYKFTDDQLWDILEMVTPMFNSEYTIDTLPGTLFYYPLLLAKKEIYYRLATSTAPFYPLQAEGASLEKNVRFDHYIKLIKQVEEDYNLAVERLDRLNEDGDGGAGGALGVVQTYETKVLKSYYWRRNYNLSQITSPAVTVVTIRDTSVDVKWNKYDAFVSGEFDSYKVYIHEGTEPIIDEFSDNPFSLDYYPALHTLDIHKTKLRVVELKPDTDYVVCLVVENRLGLKGYSEQSFRTKP